MVGRQALLNLSDKTVKEPAALDDKYSLSIRFTSKVEVIFWKGAYSTSPLQFNVEVLHLNLTIEEVVETEVGVELCWFAVSRPQC